jgi:hypothetical protein
MRCRWLAPVGVVLLAALVRAGPLPLPPTSGPAGYLVMPTAGTSALQVMAYFPQAGDILLYDDENPWYHFGFMVVGSGAPMHVAVAFSRDDGSPALLDIAGPTVRGAKVALLEVVPRLSTYQGVVLVRRLVRPLTPEQAADLRHFAQAQEGKHFAFGRLLLQATPLRARFGLRRWLFAGTVFDRDRWLCSELVVAALAVAHVLDPATYPANAMYPRDLAYNEAFDLSSVYQTPVLWVADPHPHIQGGTVEVFLN